MTRRGGLGDVVETKRRNAAIAWALVSFLVIVALASAAEGDLLWAGFAAAVAVLSLIPALVHRRIAVMLPWEVLLLAGLPLIGRLFATGALTGRFATYLAVAAVALIIAVELHVFTPVRMTAGFAVLFVVIATMATAGVWAVTRWLLDVTLGTAFILDPALTGAEIEAALMWEFVYSTAAGAVAGTVFEGYFRRRAGLSDRLAGEAVGR